MSAFKPHGWMTPASESFFRGEHERDPEGVVTAVEIYSEIVAAMNTYATVQPFDNVELFRSLTTEGKVALMTTPFEYAGRDSPVLVEALSDIGALLVNELYALPVPRKYATQLGGTISDLPKLFSYNGYSTVATLIASRWPKRFEGHQSFAEQGSFDKDKLKVFSNQHFPYEDSKQAELLLAFTNVDALEFAYTRYVFSLTLQPWVKEVEDNAEAALELWSMHGDSETYHARGLKLSKYNTGELSYVAKEVFSHLDWDFRRKVVGSQDLFYTYSVIKTLREKFSAQHVADILVQQDELKKMMTVLEAREYLVSGGEDMPLSWWFEMVRG